MIAAKQQRQAQQQEGGGGGGPAKTAAVQGIYARHRRPKSCKYDTYRLRSRTSVVEENLFGEPLKNRLMMARSRSMEAISQGASPPGSDSDSQAPHLPQTRQQQASHAHKAQSGPFQKRGKTVYCILHFFSLLPFVLFLALKKASYWLILVYQTKQNYGLLLRKVKISK